MYQKRTVIVTLANMKLKIKYLKRFENQVVMESAHY